MTKKERYEARKSAGLCVHCGKPARDGKVTCAECAEKKSAYGKDIIQWRRDLKLCTRCGKPVYKGALCLVCRSNSQLYAMNYEKTDKDRERQREANKRLYDTRKAEHKCTNCGRELSENDKHTRCTECRNHKARLERERNNRTGKKTPIELRGNGEYCAICLKPVENKGKKLCNRCYERCCKQAEIMREKVPKDNYFAQQIKYQWKCSIERSKTR